MVLAEHADTVADPLQNEKKFLRSTGRIVINDNSDLAGKGRYAFIVYNVWFEKNGILFLGLFNTIQVLLPILVFLHRLPEITDIERRIPDDNAIVVPVMVIKKFNECV